jgi:hypothetical protein
MMGTVIENNLYFSNLLIIIEDHPVVLSLPFPNHQKSLRNYKELFTFYKNSSLISTLCM